MMPLNTEIKTYLQKRTPLPIPPLTLAELQTLADEFMADIAAKSAAFVAPFTDAEYEKIMLAINNELWQATVAAVPSPERLLLLPQCLRAENCPATFDEFGLCCAQCGQCAIGELSAIAAAKNLPTLVAEGGTVVAQLLQNAEFSAVIGVGCLASFKETFPHLLKYGIPCLGIVLTNDGCKNTRVDMAAVKAALCPPDPTAKSANGAEKTPPLNWARLTMTVDNWFTPLALREFFPDKTPTAMTALNYVAARGKRYRPQMLAAVYATLSGTNTADLPATVRNAATAVECFHQASIIHDDLEDSDEYRDGLPTLPRQIGNAAALNIGDLLIGIGYRILAQLPLAAPLKNQILLAAADAHCQLCLGQGAELTTPAPDVNAVLAIFRQKTAPALALALQLGALLAAADTATQKLLAEFSDALGVAYQLRDDLKDAAAAASLPQIFRRQNLPDTTAELFATYRARVHATLRNLTDPELKKLLFNLAGRIL